MKKFMAVIFSACIAASCIGCSSSSDNSGAPATSTVGSGNAAASSSTGSSAEGVTSLADTEAEGHLKSILENGKLVVGVEATYPPFESYDETEGEKIIGYDIDICQAIADDLGVELEVKDMAFDGIIPSVQADKIDFAPNITYTEERAKAVDFSEAYVPDKRGVVVRADDDSIQTIDDLKEKNISAQIGSISEVQCRQAGLDPKLYNKNDEGLLNVQNGVVDGHVMGGTSASQYIKTMENLKVIDIPELNEGIGGMCCVTKKGETDLMNAINATIKRMEESGELKELQAKWGIF